MPEYINRQSDNRTYRGDTEIPAALRVLITKYDLFISVGAEKFGKFYIALFSEDDVEVEFIAPSLPAAFRKAMWWAMMNLPEKQREPPTWAYEI